MPHGSSCGLNYGDGHVNGPSSPDSWHLSSLLGKRGLGMCDGCGIADVLSVYPELPEAGRE